MRRHPIHLAISATVFALLLGACTEDDKKPASQVAAKVNKEEISVHQINQQLARSPNLTSEQAKEASHQVLTRLVDQELMVQQAIESKLDRDPRTVQTIESTRREILARAYVDKVAAALPKPGEQEVKDYYAKHPELFAERRVYNFNEIVIRGNPKEVLPGLQERLGKAKSLAEVGEWLKQQNLPLALNNATKAAEQLPLELLPRFHQMKDGQIGMIPGRDSILLVQLAASRPEPLDEKAATPFIQQFLFNQRRVEAVDKELKSLREKAKIEYVGDFAQLAKADAAASAPARKSVEDGAKNEKGAATEAIDKGIAGLK
jgi:EpsD family peptidyl-prolyl cis-trans isomerase